MTGPIALGSPKRSWTVKINQDHNVISIHIFAFLNASQTSGFFED